MSRTALTLSPPEGSEQLALARAIIREYADELTVDLCFQNLDRELEDLPGEYTPPGGLLLLAWLHGQVAGCCAMRPLQNVDYANACEMKRLYVRPAFRRDGVGRQLAEAILEASRQAGYSCMLLDTLNEMESARQLYQELGFIEIPPYYFNPIEGAHYLMVRL